MSITSGSPIHHFPGPRPDELFYSVASRFCWNIRYPSNRITMESLFGCEHVVATIEFPTRLAYLQEHLDPDDPTHPCKSDTLIDQTTLLPWYAPFLPPARVTQMRETMLHGTGEGLHTMAGIVAGGVPTPAFIRYCPACMKDTIAQHEYRLRNFSERRRSLIHIPHPLYWQRLPQMSGIEVCPTHNVHLENSEVMRHRRQDRHRFEWPPIELGWGSRCRPGTDATLLRVAQMGAALLSKQWQLPAGVTPTQAWHRLLTLKGYTLLSGQVKLAELVEVVRQTYTDDYLTRINSRLSAGELPLRPGKTWVAQLLNKENAHAPIRHLLLLVALNATLEEFFAATVAPAPPMPTSACGNPLCILREIPVPAHTHHYSPSARGMVALYRCEPCGREWRERTDKTGATRGQQPESPLN